MTSTCSAQRSCPVCTGRECIGLHFQRFVLAQGHPLGNGYLVVQCSGCGMVYADTAVTQSQFNQFYARNSKYEDSKTATGGGGSSWDQRRLQAAACEIANRVPAHARVVDIGAANGGLLIELGHLGFSRLGGIDPSPNCVRNMHARGLEAWSGTLADIPPEAGSFDCVVLSHVLEHVWDVSSAVVMLEKVVLPGGLIYAEVPDASRYHEFVVAPFQEFNTEHINHFSPAALVNLFGRFGWRAIHVGQKEVPSSLDGSIPAVYGWFRKEEFPVAAAKDEHLGKAINQYIDCSQEKMDAISRHLAAELDGLGSIVVWGAGQLTMKLLAETKLAGQPVRAFIDSNPANQGKEFRGVPVVSPAEFKERAWNDPILVGSLLHEREIVDVIRHRLGFENRVIRLGKD